ncbi:hypothetical protein ACM39_06505 [Chryseobacterium sp. FH2]|uniref:hypothetical protein n=1 Tax=Chryseobacterium sp. FH2 TaxID=1674291 RepID=UPI00065AA2C0|nr:hypothetical protein [Chryseobacterium sp. FH2]KMQ68929.1 hypothetical protein ACM39_06505 [Chryseobacterium sp. FH2]
MRKLVTIYFCTAFSVSFGQNVGINTVNPSATLDIVSKGNTAATNSLNINNSSSARLLRMTDQGNLGINTNSSPPTAVLHINSEGISNVRHDNLPVLNPTDFTPPFNTFGVTSNGNGVDLGGTVKYMYYQNANTYPSTYNTTTNTGGFSLYTTNQYVNLAIKDDPGLKGNTIGFTFGTDPSATINGQSASNVNYIIVPEPGVYLFEFYGTARCDRYNNTQNYTLAGQMQVNTIFATASGNTYTTNTIFRGLMNGMRNNDGSTHANSYGIANPQTLTVAFPTTQPNQKVALFFQYANGETNQFTHSECFFNVPSGANFSYYFIVTKI